MKQIHIGASQEHDIGHAKKITDESQSIYYIEIDFKIKEKKAYLWK